MSQYTIALTNLTGARNRGVEALAASTMHGIQQLFGESTIAWRLHTNDPLYDAWRYRSFKAKTFFSYLTNTPEHTRLKWFNNLLYSTLSLTEKTLPKRLKMLCSQQDVRKADLTICSGGDIFTSDYNNLKKHLAYPIISRKTYLCSHTIGPFMNSDERYFLKCAGNIDAISVRETISYDYLHSILPKDIRLELVADVAFSLPLDQALGKKILHDHLHLEEQFVAISISKGLARYSNISETAYMDVFVQFCDQLIEAGYHILLVPHVTERNPNNNDLIISRELIDRVSAPEKCRILSFEYSASEIKSVISHAKALVGARTHATIASMSQCIPTVSIAYSRKAYGIVKDVYGDSYDKVIVDAKEISAARLSDAFSAAMANTINAKTVESIKQLSLKNFSIAKDLLEQ